MEFDIFISMHKYIFHLARWFFFLFFYLQLFHLCESFVGVGSVGKYVDRFYLLPTFSNYEQFFLSFALKASKKFRHFYSISIKFDFGEYSHGHQIFIFVLCGRRKAARPLAYSLFIRGDRDARVDGCEYECQK